MKKARQKKNNAKHGHKISITLELNPEIDYNELGEWHSSIYSNKKKKPNELVILDMKCEWRFVTRYYNWHVICVLQLVGRLL